MAEIRPELTHHAEIVGTLAYMAPEQTGRTGRSVDQRADLYALGTTLYELAVGAPPFGSGDPLRRTHDHLARVPEAPGVPEPPAAILLHLLEKEPDRRYQSADGLVYDLERLRGGDPLEVGAHDVPLRLLPPSRRWGVRRRRRRSRRRSRTRCREAAAACWSAARRGSAKTALVDGLRPLVQAHGGWFVAGKFDEYRRDLEFDAVNQALRSLGRLLLAEPEAELADLCARIMAALGANAGLLTAAVPEFAALLGVPPEPGDPLTAQARAQRTAVQLLRAVASRERPLAVFLDDLHWAGRTPLGVVDLVLGEEPVDGLLLIGAYGDGDLDVTHPPAEALSRWRLLRGVRHLRPANLPGQAAVAMVAEMLGTDRATAASLTEHAGAAAPLLPAAAGSYATAVIFLLRGLALAVQARATDDRDDLLAELDEVTRWLAARAAIAPDNFLHLLRLVEAECAWAAGDFKSAVLAFDGARREVAGQRRPWHRALIAERAAASISPSAPSRPATSCSPRPGAPTSRGARRQRPPGWTGPIRPCKRRRTRPAAPSPPGRSTCSASCRRPARSARRPTSSGCTRASPRCSAR